MRGKRYTQDYGLESVLDHKGRQRTVSVYKGPRFVFTAPPEAVEREKRVLPVLTGLVLIAVFIPLCLRAESMHLWYVSVPIVVSLIPFWMLATACAALIGAKPPVTREVKDRVHERTVLWSFVLCFLSLFALVGQIVHLANGGGGADWAVGACSLAALVLAILIFRRRKTLLMEELPPEPSEEAPALPPEGEDIP